MGEKIERQGLLHILFTFSAAETLKLILKPNAVKIRVQDICPRSKFKCTTQLELVSMHGSHKQTMNPDVRGPIVSADFTT